ncbi:DNA-binding response regulator, partial [bacterium]
MRILIAEPDEYYHHHYADFLGSLGELRFVKEADGVWGIMEQFQPDVFITELLLPEKGAYEILKKIRSDGKNSAMSVLVFTRVQNMEDIKA